MVDERRIDQRAGTKLIHLFIHAEHDLRRLTCQQIMQTFILRGRKRKRQQIHFLLVRKDFLRHHRILRRDTNQVRPPIRISHKLVLKEKLFQGRDIRLRPVELHVSVKESLALRRAVS